MPVQLVSYAMSLDNQLSHMPAKARPIVQVKGMIVSSAQPLCLGAGNAEAAK